MRIEYQECGLDAVVHHFAEFFKAKAGESVQHVEFFIDPVQKVVVFKIFIKEKGEK